MMVVPFYNIYSQNYARSYNGQETIPLWDNLINICLQKRGMIIFVDLLNIYG